MKTITKVLAVVSTAAITVVSASCSSQEKVQPVKINQEKIEKPSPCDKAEDAILTELDNIDTLSMKHKALRRKSELIKNQEVDIEMATKIMNSVQDFELEYAQALEVFKGKVENYDIRCQNDERREKFRTEKIVPEWTRIAKSMGIS